MNYKFEGITVGSDPEFFIVNKRGNLVSSIGIINGTKSNPDKIKSMGDGYMLQKDNVLGEFNVPYAYTAHECSMNIELMKAYIRGYLDTHGLEPMFAASAIYPKAQLNSREAKEFGCSPDYNAWTDDANPRPEGQATNLRSAGCHIHVGYENPTKKISLDIIKTLDLFLGVPSVVIDTDTRRRSLYGKAGCFRHTSFGVEYRVLSGFFISDYNLTLWAFKQVFKALWFLEANGIEQIEMSEERICDAINNGDVELAKELISEFNLTTV
jgi:hypothetical protein